MPKDQLENRRIVFMDSDIPSIYFPIGRPEVGGTCYFATKKCQECCPSGQRINEHERHTLEVFQKWPANVIVEKIILDYEQLAGRPYNAHMLQWFTWGDCPPTMTEKIAEIVVCISDRGIPQYGFTRNKELWLLMPRRDNLHFGLTIDNLAKAKAVSLEYGKMTACPDYATGYARMIYGGYIVASCNGWWCITEKETRNSDCTQCHVERSGCYA